MEAAKKERLKRAVSLIRYMDSTLWEKKKVGRKMQYVRPPYPYPDYGLSLDMAMREVLKFVEEEINKD